MASADGSVMQYSEDSQLLMKTAVEFARSESLDVHESLFSYLAKEDFLNRLDGPEDYLAPPRQLRLARVMKTLMSNPVPWSKQVLVRLTGAQTFISFEPRQELLIRALVIVRPAPPQSVSFWNEHSQPESPYLHVTISALADNGSPPALELLEQKMADPQLEPTDKVAWIRDPILVHRNEPAMLESCERMLATGLPPDLRPSLVEGLFDYKPEWYLSCEPPHPPPRLAMSDEARRILRSIGSHALESLSLEEPLKATVQSVLREGES
jgi:hypothetical protein